MLAFLSLGFFHSDFKYENELDINASPSNSFEIFNNDSLKSQWLTGFIEHENLTGSVFQPGHRKLLKFKRGEQTFEMVEELLEIYKGDKIVFAIETELFDGINELYFMGSKNKCTLKSYTTIKGTSIFYRAMFYILKSSMQNQTQQNYEALKKVIEKQEETYKIDAKSLN